MDMDSNAASSTPDEDVLLEDSIPVEQGMSENGDLGVDNNANIEYNATTPAQIDALSIAAPVTSGHTWEDDDFEGLTIRKIHEAYNVDNDSNYPSTE